MKHIKEILTKNPPKKGKPRRSKNGKKGVTKRRIIVPAVERYATVNSFHFTPEKKTKAELRKGGRPSVMTAEIVRKLEVSFAYDATVEEACLDAGISTRTYYDFLAKYPEFAQRVEALRNAPFYVIRKKVIAESEHNAEMGLKFLERKKKMEFSTRAEISHSGEVINRHAIDPETAARIERAMSGWGKKVKELKK